MSDDVEDTDSGTYPPEIQAALDGAPWEVERYEVGECESTVRGVTTHPWEGQGVWLAPFEAPVALIEAGTGLSSGKAERVADGFPSLREGLACVVYAHDLRDAATGELYPQIWHDAAAVLAWPSSLLFHVWSIAVSGEAPDARPKGSSRGRGGTSTRSSGARSRSKS